MNLFDDVIDPQSNLLKKDGVLNYYGPLMATQEANFYLNTLFNETEWKNDEAIIYGKKIVTRRKVAWYGAKPFEYTYSKTTKKALPFTASLLTLKKIVEEKSGEKFNSCLLNLYHDGREGMAWHSDSERDLKKNGAIGSLSFGAERKFSLKHKITKETLSLVLEHGSLLIMKGSTQSYWLHSLPITRKVNQKRINLTFRTIETYDNKKIVGGRT